MPFESQCKNLFKFGVEDKIKEETDKKESIFQLKAEIRNTGAVLVHEGKEISSVYLDDSRLFLTKSGVNLDFKFTSSFY